MPFFFFRDDSGIVVSKINTPILLFLHCQNLDPT